MNPHEPHITTILQPEFEDNEPNDRKQKMISLLVAVLVHVVIALVVTLIVVTHAKKDVPTIIGIADGAVSVNELKKKSIQQRVQRRPSANSSPKTNLMSASAVSNIAIPTVDDINPMDDIGFGTDLGEGLGFGDGMGLGGGGMISFLGQESKAQRVVFVVDASMSAKHVQLMKDELEGSLNKLPPNVEYQVLFFAGPVWSADEKVTKGARKQQKGAEVEIEPFIGGGSKKWEQGAGAQGYTYEGKGDYPVYEWKKSDKKSIKKTIDNVKKVNLVYGTDWLVSLMTALNMDPKPDVIYFVTDGSTGKPDQIVKEVVREARRGKDTQINTIGLLKPQQAGGLRDIAKGTKGKFKLVTE